MNRAVIRRNNTRVDHVDPQDLERGVAHIAWRMIQTLQDGFGKEQVSPSALAGMLLQFNDRQLLEAFEASYNNSHEIAFGAKGPPTTEMQRERKLLFSANSLFSPGLDHDVKIFKLRNAIGAYLKPEGANKLSMQ